MPVLIQVCIVAATIALIAVAVSLIRVLGQLRRAAEQLERSMIGLDQAIPKVTQAVEEARDVLASVHTMTNQVQGIVSQFEPVGRKAAQISSLFVDEIVEPAGRIAALVRGVKVGASALVGNLFHSRGDDRARLSGGNHDE